MRTFPLACAVLALLPAATAAATPTLIAAGPDLRAVDALDGVVAWARPDGASSRLVVRRNGLAADADAPRVAGTVSADLDLGRDARGRLVATYVTCRGSRCRAVAYDVARGRARTLPTPLGKRCSVTSVAVWRTRLAVLAGCRPPKRPHHVVTRLVLQRGSHATELAREPNVPYDRADIRGTTVVASKRAPASEAAVMLARADRTCATEVSFGASNDYYDREVGSARIGSRGVTWVTNIWSIEEDGSQRRAADVDLGVPSQGCRVDRGPRWSVMAQFGLAPPDCPEGTLDAPGCGLTDAAADRGSLFVATLGIWQLPAYAR